MSSFSLMMTLWAKTFYCKITTDKLCKWFIYLLIKYTELLELLVSMCCRVMSNCFDLPYLLGKLCGQKLLDLGLSAVNKYSMQIDCIFLSVHMFNDIVCVFGILNICHSDHTCYEINTDKYILPLTLRLPDYISLAI